MAYSSHNLSVIAYADGFTLFHYMTLDTGYEVAGDIYFNGAADMLREGDIILVNAAAWSGVLAVMTNDNRTVAVDILTPRPSEPK